MEDLISFFAIQRSIFGLCPCCGSLFRLSNCRVYLRKNPPRDWMTVLEDNEKKIVLAEESIAEIENDLRVQARARGRKNAQKAIRSIDRVFSPRKLHADDAKVLLHPVDYIVFSGMNSSNNINRIVFLDRLSKDAQRRRLQRSIEKTIEAGKYEWVTLRVSENGTMSRS